MAYPCPQCGVKKGGAHATWCKRAQNRRKPGFGKLPRSKQARYEKHTCVPRVHKTRGDTEYLRCKVCSRRWGNGRKDNDVAMLHGDQEMHL